MNNWDEYMGLGAVHMVSLVQAREKTRQARESLARGIDPSQARRAIAIKKETVIKKERVNASSKTFDRCAAQYIAKRKSEWKSEKHRMQWESTLKKYASPHFGKMDVRLITTSHILKALEPIWVTKTETATRLRERIERVLSWATTISLPAFRPLREAASFDAGVGRVVCYCSTSTA